MFHKKSDTINKNSNIFFVVGLGNPGEQYCKTRHNAGFEAIDYVASQLNTDISKSKFNALFADAKIENKRCFLVKPQTYMNLSGESVIKFVDFYQIPTENIVVIFDDISLPVGSMRIRRKGTHGGHNGVKNIINLLGSDNFPRIKIGVGNKPDFWDLADWVLSKFTKNELADLEEVHKKCFEALNLIINDKINEAMNNFN